LRRRSNRRTLERGHHVLADERRSLAALERLESVERLADGLVGMRVPAGVVGDGRCLEAPGVANEQTEQGTRCGGRMLVIPELGECRDRRAAQLLGLLLDASGVHHRAPPQAALDVVDGPALEAGERRAQEGEQLGAAAAEPVEAEKCEKRRAEGRLTEPRPLLDRVRDSERAEHGLERRTPALDRLADDADPLRRRARADERDDLGGDELRSAAHARALEEVHRAVERDLRRGRVGKELALDSCQGGCHRKVGRGRQLLDRARCQPGEITDGPLERRERGATRLVRDRDRDVGPRAQRLDERPLGRGQVLEAVRKHGRAVPGSEIGLQPLGGGAPKAVAVPRAEPVELLSIRTREPTEIALDFIRVDERGLELAERAEQNVREASGCCGSRERVELCARYCAACDERPLRVGQELAPTRITGRNMLEEIVERTDAAGEERRPAQEQVALDPLDVGTVRDDQPRIAVEHAQKALEEQGDFAGVRRPHDQREGHASS
jgi:hypothetical protein